MNKIIIISENLKSPFDEGFKNFIYQIVIFFYKKYPNLIFFSNSDLKIKHFNLPNNKLLFSFFLIRFFRKEKGIKILYIPKSSITLFSFIRSKLLRIYSLRANVILLGLQKRSHTFISRQFIKFLKPELLIVTSSSEKVTYEKLGIKTKIILPGVDINKFNKVNIKEKKYLRKKYNLPLNKKIILHVGHIRKSRNLDDLIYLAKNDYFILIIASSSTKYEKKILDKVRNSGIKIFNSYIKNINEIYQLSDLYVFPVVDSKGAIEFPLSILEAMSCNLPILSRSFGDIKKIFKDADNIIFYKNKNEMLNYTELLLNKKNINNREIVLNNFTWDKQLKELDLLISRGTE